MAPTAAPPAERLESAAAVRAAHLVLLESLPDAPDPAALARVSEFIRTAAATGLVLDDSDDRKQVQGLIDYWVASLLTEYRGSASRLDPDQPGRGKLPNTLLAEFDPKEIPAAVSRADAILSRLSAADRRTVRRILLRLVRLREAEPVFDPMPIPRTALSDVASGSDKVDKLIDEMARAGVVRRTAGNNPAGELIALRAGGLITDWPTLAEWLRERLQFRDLAARWKADRERAARLSLTGTLSRVDDWITRNLVKIGLLVDTWLTPFLLRLRRRSGLMTPSDLLLSGDDLEDGRAYHDRNPVEQEFTEASRDQQQLDSRRNRVLMGAFGLMMLAAVVGWVAAVSSAYVADSERLAAKVSEQKARESAKDAERLRAAAERSLTLVAIRRSNAFRQHEKLEAVEDKVVVLETLLDRPEELAKFRGDQAYQQLVKGIRSRQTNVKEFRDPDPNKPLRPGHRIWIETRKDGPSVCSVCCIVRLKDKSDNSTFAVAYCSPLAREGESGVIVRRVDQNGGEVGRLADLAALRGGPQGPSGDEPPIEIDWIALVKLHPGVPADNRIPVLGQQSPIRLSSTVKVGDPIRVVGGSSGHGDGRLLEVEQSGVIQYKAATTIGDGGGSILNESNELIAIRGTNLGDDRAQGYLIGPWLNKYGLELID